MEIQGGVREENEVGGGLKGKRISNFPSPCSLYLLGFFFLKGLFPAQVHFSYPGKQSCLFPYLSSTTESVFST